MMITIIDSPISWVLAALILFVLGCIFQKWMAADSKAAGVITDKLQEEDDRKTDIIKHLLSSLLYDCGYGNDCVYLKDEGTYMIEDLLQEFPIGPDTWKKITDPDKACLIEPSALTISMVQQLDPPKRKYKITAEVCVDTPDDITDSIIDICIHGKDAGHLERMDLGADSWQIVEIKPPREGREYSPITCSNQLQPAEEKTTICDSCYAGSKASELMQDDITGFWHCQRCRPDLHNEPPTDKKKESKACQ